MEDKKERGGHGVLIALVVVLLVYVFCPYTIAYPMFMVAKAVKIPPEHVSKVEILFYPVDILYRKVPIYHDLMEAEKELLKKIVGTPSL